MPSFPVDTAHMVCLCGGVPEPVTDFGTGVPKLDTVTNKPLVSVPVVLISDGHPEVAAVKVPGPVAALTVGAPVALDGLVATTWAMGDRSGVAFRANSITPAAGARGVAEARSGQ